MNGPIHPKPRHWISRPDGYKREFLMSSHGCDLYKTIDDDRPYVVVSTTDPTSGYYFDVGSWDCADTYGWPEAFVNEAKAFINLIQ